jgi:AraC-like DNA-binding protein
MGTNHIDGSDHTVEAIEVRHSHDVPGLELRIGARVARTVPRHWHEEYQFCLMQFGSGELTYRSNNLLTPTASLFMVHPGEVHANRCTNPLGVGYRNVFIDVELMSRLAAEVVGKTTALPFLPTAVVFNREIINHFINFCSAVEAPSSLLEVESLLLTFIGELMIRFAETPPAVTQSSREQHGITRARDYLVDHYADNVSLLDLAGIAKLSRFHFTRVFCNQFGMPPHAYQTQIRILRARRLLIQGESIADIATQTGPTAVGGWFIFGLPQERSKESLRAGERTLNPPLNPNSPTRKRISVISR